MEHVSDLASTEDPHISWAGREVVLIGRFASMSRESVRDWLASAQAHLATHTGPETDYVIVGQAAPPLGPDGQPIAKLRRAFELQKATGRPRILREEEWLAEFDAPGDQTPTLQRLYTSEQLARILSVNEAQLRTWVRKGLLEPARRVGRLAFFDFRDVASAKALSSLTQAGVGSATIRRGIEQLRQWLPGAEVTLSQLEALDRKRVTVHLADGQVAETNGQLQLDFRAPPRARSSESLQSDARRSELEGEIDPGPEVFIEAGLEAEERGDWALACIKYEQTLAKHGLDPLVCFNLGNVLYALDRPAEAAHRFLQAAELESEHVEAWNNLGNVLAELGQIASALMAYRSALKVAPDYPDAHYNLAEALDAQGDHIGARRHWQAYLRLDPFSRWARRVRERLQGPVGSPPDAEDDAGEDIPPRGGPES